MEVNPQIESSWKEILRDEFEQQYFKELKEFSYSTFKDKWNVHYSRAIENQLDVLPIRQSELGIPETWTLKQANRVLKYARTFECKGLFRSPYEDNFDKSFEKAMGA